MINFIYSLSSFTLFITIFFLIAILSTLGLILASRFFSLANRYRENNVMGQILNLVAIIYAIILGFIVLYELNNFNQANNAEEKEANRILSVYREASFLPDPLRATIQTQIKNYTKSIITNEWPALTRGERINDNSLLILNTINQQFYNYKSLESLPHLKHLTLDNLYREVTNLYKDREERIALANTAVNANVWVVLIIGSFLTILITCLFGMELKTHILTLGMVALILASAIFLVIVLDRPYRGTFAVKPSTFIFALTTMNNSQK